MIILENVSLKDYNTFRVDVRARFFAEVSSVTDLKEIISDRRFTNTPKYILGEGSNSLFTKDIEGLVIKSNLKGIEQISEDDKHVTLNIASGENWHELVMWSVEQNLSGIENLAYIPGNVGAAPIQNLAAYGQPFEDVMISADTINLETGEEKTFSKKDSKLAYRTSIFKDKYRHKLFITSVTIQLNKFLTYDTHYHGRFAYESLQMFLDQIKPPPYTPKDIAEAVIAQRKTKLPDVEKIPSCGSFFVNPFVTVERFKELAEEIEGLQHYPVNKMEYDRIDWHNTGADKIVKIPAGRLLEELGWRGKWIGNVGTHDKHALIIVTNGRASGLEILEFSRMMQKSIKDAYDIELTSEVNII